MQDLFIEFLPPWVETGHQPAFYDRESGTVLQQTARMYAKVNELVKAVNGMDKVIKEYVDYIDNYFKNLDVQEEVNNKLDDMAEGGELADIIAQFLAMSPVFGYDTISELASATNLADGCIARVLGNTDASDGNGAYYTVRTKESGESGDGYSKVEIGDDLIADRITESHDYLVIFDSVSDMASDTDLKAGDIVKTAGFYSATNGGGATYLVREPEENETANGRSTIALQSDLIAELLPSESINVDVYGAYGDGIHDDYDAIQFAISNNLHHTINFSDKTYAIGSTLKTWANQSKKTFFNLKKSTKIIALNNLDALIEFGGLGGSLYGIPDRRKELKGGLLDATNCECAIKIATNDADVEIRECEIINVNHYGIFVPHDNAPSNITIDNVIIYGIGADYDTYGLYCSRSDNFLRNSHIRGCRYSLYFTNSNGGHQILNVNGLGFGSQDPWFDNSCFLRIDGKLNQVSNCYCDTFKHFADVFGDVVISNCIYYSYKQNVDVELFKIENDVARLILSNNTFTMPTPNTYHKGVYYASEGSWNSVQTVCRNITIEDNIIRNFSNNDENIFNTGDLILSNDKSFSTYFNFTSKFTNQTDWVKIGDIMEGNFVYDLDIVINGKRFNSTFYVQRSGSSNVIQNYSTEKNDENITIQLGFVYQNNYNGYKTYGVYMRQTAGTQMWINPIITNKAPSKFMACKYTLGGPTLETMTINSTITI